MLPIILDNDYSQLPLEIACFCQKLSHAFGMLEAIGRSVATF